MGLAEKRVVKDFQDNHFPKFKGQVTDSAKFDVEIEVDWDKLAEPEYSHLYIECWEKVYFMPLVEALNSITADDMGAEALKESLKKIHITNETECSNSGRWATFEGGVLKLDHKPCTNVDQIKDRAAYTIKLLEDNL